MNFEWIKNKLKKGAYPTVDVVSVSLNLLRFVKDILWESFLKSNSKHFSYSMSLTNLNIFRDTDTTSTVG